VEGARFGSATTIRRATGSASDLIESSPRRHLAQPNAVTGVDSAITAYTNSATRTVNDQVATNAIQAKLTAQQATLSRTAERRRTLAYIKELAVLVIVQR
jgi:hypothetical protein